MHTCPACSHGVESNLLACPHCGIALNLQATATPHRQSLAVSLGAIIAVGVLAILICGGLVATGHVAIFRVVAHP